MKKIYMYLMISMSFVFTVEAVRVKIASREMLEQKLVEKKFNKFMEGTQIVNRLADKEMDEEEVTGVMYEELKHYLGKDYNQQHLEVLHTFGFFYNVLTSLGISVDPNNIKIPNITAADVEK